MSDIPLGSDNLGRTPIGSTTIVTPTRETEHNVHLRNRASWGAILAGVVTALVVQAVLNVLGVGIGMSSVDAANLANNPSAQTSSGTAAGWIVLSGILASFLGGIVAGRLCGSADRSTARWHGFVSWAATTLCLVYLLSSAAGGLIGGAFGAVGSTLSGIGKSATAVVSGAAQSGAANPLETQVHRLINPTDAQSATDNVTSYLQATISGDKAAADGARDRAVDSIARSANISPDDARTRLNQAETQARQAADVAKQKAQEAAEATRKTLAMAGLFGFVALVLGAFAATIGGQLGTPLAYRRID